MRVLISTRPGAGHFGPLIPFAHALLRGNHEVVVVAPASAAPMIAAAGLDHHPIPDPPQQDRSQILDTARTLDADDANELVVGDIFIRIDTRAAYPHLRAAIDSRRPDIVLYDISEFAAGLAAEAAGVPAVTVGITLGVHMHRLGPAIAEALDEVRAEVGLEADPRLERLAATPCFTLMPEQLEDPAAADARMLRFREPAPREPRPLPAWWRNHDWPLVYLTFGSVAPELDYFPGLYRSAIDALSVLPVRVLVTRRERARSRRPRRRGAERARRALGAAGRRHAARGGHGLPRRLGHGPRGAGGRGAAGRRAAVRRPAAQRPPGGRARGRRSARARRPRPAARRRAQRARRAVVPRGGEPDRGRRARAADRRHRDPDPEPAGAGGGAFHKRS